MEVIAQYRKFIVAFAGVLAQVITANVLTGTALHYAQVISAACAALLVVAVPNAVVPPG